MSKRINTSIFSSDGRVRPGMGLKRVVREDNLRKSIKAKSKAREQERKERYRFERLSETYVRFLMRSFYKYQV